jgi:two-component system, chemotaxis family, CheB/CheR fusion protein
MNDHETAAIFGDGKPGDGPNFLVVGIGASAGGIGALRDFFSKVPEDSGIAYIVILHLSPDHDSKLADVLQNVASIPVRQVTKRTGIEPNHVYVVPPNKSLGIEDGHITIRKTKSVEERRAPVDIFFRKLAETLQSRAVAVILSGTGANGSMGMKRIKEFGGAAFVQNPREAEFNEMPRNSIATELVDSILPVAEIPQRILAYRDRIGAVVIPEEPRERRDDEQQALREIFTHLRVRTGHDFSNYKRATILRRIERRISVRNLPDIQSYASYLKENPEEPQALLKDLLISVTNFFRDQKAWEYLEKEYVPRLIKERQADSPVRIWVTGCATGEEAYSIAMIFAEQAFGLPAEPSIQIFATDIDEQAIAVAREGIYTLNDAADVSPERLRRFFLKEGDHYRVRRELREMILFANHNLLKDPPFSHLDLVTCRNLMIYLNQAAQERIMETIHFALKPGGYLFIGSSESVDGAGDLFAHVSKEHHLFQSRQVTARPLPIPESVPVFRSIQPQRHEEVVKPPTPLERITYNELHVRLLEEYAPPSVVVNENYDIVHLSQGAGKYLRFTGGEPTNNLMRLVLPDIRLELRTALFQAVQQRTNVEAQNVKVRTSEGDEIVNILIRPVLDDGDTSRGFVLVLFEPAVNGTVAEPVYAAPEPLARQLEEELIRSKAQLQSALEQSEIQSEELRASNEELQAMNEELRSSAEELETSKEELQSINEELTTVNQELKVKIEELSHSNTNFQNLLNSIDIGTIFLDRALKVRLFSPAARELFNLIPGDIGRPLSDITSKFEEGDLLDDAERVLKTLQTAEREVQTRDGQTFVMRILPYRTADERINGVIVIFVDITERKRMESALRAGEERLRMLMESFTDFAIFTIDVNGNVKDWNPGAEAIFGYSAKDILGKSADVVFTPEDRAASVPDKERETARRKGRASDERWHVRKDGTRFFASGVMVPLSDDKKHLGFAKIARDLTASIQAKETIIEREMLKRLVDAQEDERRRIARDLHDQLGQQLTGLRLKLEGLKTKYQAEPAMIKAIDDTQKQAQKIDKDISFLAWELRPTALDSLGLRNALANYVVEWSKTHGIAAEFHTGRARRRRLVPETEVNLYRIVQEALNNVLKHAKASKVDVLLEFNRRQVSLIVEDNGIGFDPKAKSKITRKGKGLGLVGMRERANLLGGNLEVESAPGKGTTIIVRVPMRMINEKTKKKAGLILNLII